MKAEFSAKKLALRAVKDSLSITIGAFLCAFALYSFIIPNNFVSGGVSGIATLLEAAGIIKAYISQLIMNAPLLIAALIWLRKDFAFKTIACTVLISLIMALMERIQFARFAEDRLLAAIYAGIAYGIGLGILYECGGSSGGSEIVANLVVRRNPSAKIYRLIMIMDVIVIIAGLVLFDIWSVAYAVICSFFCERAMAVYVGRGSAYGVYYFITGRPGELREALTKEFYREGVEVDAVGLFTGNTKTVMQMFLPMGSETRVKQVVEKTDKESFNFVLAGRAAGKENKIK